MVAKGVLIAMLAVATNNAARAGPDDAIAGAACRRCCAMPNLSATRLPFGAHWLVLDLLGAAMLVAGVLGLAGAGTHLDARLGDGAVAWSLTLAGAALTAFAAINIAREIRAHAQADRSSRSSR
jgi:hypothetical protein